MKRLMIAGGGTGGHVLAGVALASEWKAKTQLNSDILFIGARGGIEERLVPKAGFALKALSLGGVKRVGMKKKLTTLMQLPIAHVLAFKWILEFKPEVVIGVGGYSSGPVLVSAWLYRSLFRRKCVLAILEQNSVPGFTNRMLSRVSDLIFTAFPECQGQFPGKQVYFTGNPVRTELWKVREMSDERGASGLFSLFIFGGSQGAVGMNTLVIEMLSHLFSRIGPEKFKIVHQTGKRDFERIKACYQPWSGKLASCRIVEFIDNMAAEYRDASVVICRAGSSSLSEIAAVGRAAVLVPLPTAADDHQRKNAEALVKLGAAICLDQRVTKGSDFAELIADLVACPEKVQKMEEAVQRLAVPDACGRMIDALTDSR